MTQKTTDELLQERGRTHGEYTHHARVTQGILDICSVECGWASLPPIMRETVHMIAHKIGRVVTGNPYINDHWDDIAGYARLVSQRVNGEGLVGEHHTGAYSLVFAGEERDIYSELAVRWGCSRDMAKKRALALLFTISDESVAEMDRILSILSPAQDQMARDAAQRTYKTGSDGVDRPLEVGDPVYAQGHVEKWTIVGVYGDLARVSSGAGLGQRSMVVRLDELVYAREARAIPDPKSDAVETSAAGATGPAAGGDLGSPGTPEDGGHHARSEDDEVVIEPKSASDSEDEDVSTVRREPINATWAEYSAVKDLAIRHGTMAGLTWADIYIEPGADGNNTDRYMMMVTCREEYGR